MPFKRELRPKDSFGCSSSDSAGWHPPTPKHRVFPNSVGWLPWVLTKFLSTELPSRSLKTNLRAVLWTPRVCFADTSRFSPPMSIDPGTCVVSPLVCLQGLLPSQWCILFSPLVWRCFLRTQTNKWLRPCLLPFRASRQIVPFGFRIVSNGQARINNTPEMLFRVPPKKTTH